MSRRAALRELAVLDPEVDYLRITQLVVGRHFADPVFTELLTTVAYWRQTAIPAAGICASTRRHATVGKRAGDG